MKKLNLIAIITLSMLLTLPIAAQNLQDLPPDGQQRALYALDPPLSSLLETREADRASHLGDGLQDILHRHLALRGASFDLNDHVMTGGTRFGNFYTVSGNKVAVDFTLTGRLNRCLAEFDKIEDIEVLASASTPSYHLVSVLVPVNRLLETMMVPGVAAAYGVACQTEGAGIMNGKPAKSQGSADNQAEIALDVDDLRRIFSYADGSGVAVGSLSDSVDEVGGGISDSQATGDLPSNANLTILNDWADARDEGRAMMEHIYDIAPQLDSLGFATAFGGEAVMAANITALADANMDIINDDIRYRGEPYYQDGVIAQAINSYVDGGGIYFTSGGNYGDNSYESIYSSTDGDDYHEFAAGDELATLEVGEGTAANPTTVVLDFQWAQPWGAATTDLAIDIYTFGSPPVLIHSSDTNNIGGNPSDILTFENSGAAVTYGIAIRRVSGPVDELTFKFVLVGSVFRVDLPEHPESAGGTIKPHGAMSTSIVLGAAPFYDRGVAEEFSSHGPARKFFNDAGSPITPYTLSKPDFLSIDACNTTFFGSDIPEDADAFPNFFGTSAATPNAAAVAALMLDLAGGPGTLDSDEIQRIMRMSVKDLGAEGHDTVYGHGRINALGAGVAARGALSTGHYLYLNQYGDVTKSTTLPLAAWIDSFQYSSNSNGPTTIDTPETHAEMNPMLVLFNQFGDSFIDLDYDSGPGDDARIEIANAAPIFPYIIEVLSETTFSGIADFDLVINAPDQTLSNRTANLDSNGYDAGFSDSLVIPGDTDFIGYTAPATGSLFIGFKPMGFLGYIRVYNDAGTLIDHGIVADGHEGGLSVDSVTAGETYAIQIVSWNYSGSGSYNMTADFGGNVIFSNDFEAGNTNAWSSTVGN